MNAFLKAFKHEQFGGYLEGRGCLFLFLAVAVVGKDDRHAGRLDLFQTTGWG